MIHLIFVNTKFNSSRIRGFYYQRDTNNVVVKALLLSTQKKLRFHMRAGGLGCTSLCRGY